MSKDKRKKDCGFDGNDSNKKKKRAKGKKKKPDLRPIEDWLLDYHEMFNPNDFVVHYCPRCGTPPKVFRQLLIELADRTGEDLCLPREEVCMLCNLDLDTVVSSAATRNQIASISTIVRERCSVIGYDNRSRRLRRR